MPPRIISLLPGATETVAALGAIASLVGISHECDVPDAVRRIARVSTSAVDSHAPSRDIDAQVRRLADSGRPVFALDAAQIVTLAPTLILTQLLCDVCAVSEGDVRSLASVLETPPRILALAGTTLDGVWRDIEAVGAAIGRADESTRLLDHIAGRLRAVHETLSRARAPRPRVAVVEWLDPLFAAGHWTPELVHRAGGLDVLAKAGSHSVVVHVDEVRAAAPDLLLFAPCGFDVDRAARESVALLASDAWRWARGLDAWALDANALTSRPGPRLADAVEAMAAIIAPTLFPAPRAEYARRLTG